ncbi:OmpA family protein [Noviluteimonas gilva]|uniref:OmpA family protein n=1 Tax=Noviluteimonas gilva TaxID=2682097 RepID=UPI0018D20176
MPPPTSELSAAQQSVARAESADADQYATSELVAARNALESAQSAMSAGDDEDALRFATSASAWGDLALARSRAATTQADYDQRRAEIAGLRQRLQLGANDETPALAWPAPAPAQGPDVAAALSQRLVALDADARLQGLAAYERLRARQAVDVLPEARKSDRAQATQIAQQRVQTAEIAAQTEATRREVDRLDRERSELLVEASRQEAERARQEAERLRFEAQIQMEEAQRLRATAESEAAARAQAEEIVLDVAGDQAAKLAAAKARDAELARKEAELSGAVGDLPPSKRSGGSEVFTLGGDAFASGKAALSSSGSGSVRALAAYIAAAPTGRIRIEAHTDGQGEAAANKDLSQRRANAVRDALAAAGVPKSKMTATGMGESSPIGSDDTAAGRARNRRVEIIVADK